MLNDHCSWTCYRLLSRTEMRVTFSFQLFLRSLSLNWAVYNGSLEFLKGQQSCETSLQNTSDSY